MVFVTRNEVVDSDSCVSVAACWCHDRSYIVLRVAGCDGMRVCEYQPSDPMIFPVGSFLVSKHFKTAYATGGNRWQPIWFAYAVATYRLTFHTTGLGTARGRG